MRRLSAPRIERTTCRLLGVPSLLKPARWLFHSGTSASCVRTRCGNARSSKKTCMNSSLLSAKTKSSSPSPESLAWPLPLPCPPPPLGRSMRSPLTIVLVARVHDLAHAAGAVAEHGLADVAPGDVDVLAALDVADAAAVDGALDRLADLLLVAAQEALAVADGLVLARQPPVDDVLHQAPALSWTCAPAGTTRTAAAPAWACSPWRPCG